MRFISTLVLAAALGIPLSYLGFKYTAAAIHSEPALVLFGLIIAPGQLIGLLARYLPEWTLYPCAVLIQVAYYIAIAVGLKAAFFRLFFERNEEGT